MARSPGDEKNRFGQYQTYELAEGEEVYHGDLVSLNADGKVELTTDEHESYLGVFYETDSEGVSVKTHGPVVAAVHEDAEVRHTLGLPDEAEGEGVFGTATDGDVLVTEDPHPASDYPDHVEVREDATYAEVLIR